MFGFFNKIRVKHLFVHTYKFKNSQIKIKLRMGSLNDNVSMKKKKTFIHFHS